MTAARDVSRILIVDELVARIERAGGKQRLVAISVDRGSQTVATRRARLVPAVRTPQRTGASHGRACDGRAERARCAGLAGGYREALGERGLEPIADV